MNSLEYQSTTTRTSWRQRFGALEDRVGSFPLLSFLFAGGVVAAPGVLIPVALVMAGIIGPLAIFFVVAGLFLSVFCVLAGIVCAFIGLHTGRQGAAVVALLLHVWIAAAAGGAILFFRR